MFEKQYIFPGQMRAKSGRFPTEGCLSVTARIEMAPNRS